MWTGGRGDLGDAAEARAFLRSLLGQAGVSVALVEDAVLCANEAVINAIRHGAGLASVRAEATPTLVRVEVEDHRPGEIPLVAPQPTSTSGRGLHIIDAVSARWGFEDRPVGPNRSPGKVLWFELERTDVAPPTEERPSPPLTHRGPGGVRGGRSLRGLSRG